MEEIKQSIKSQKLSDKKWQKYLIYIVILLIVIFLGIKIFGNKNIQENNQNNTAGDLVGGGMGGTEGDFGSTPPPDAGTNDGPSQPGQNAGTPPRN